MDNTGLKERGVTVNFLKDPLPSSSCFTDFRGLTFFKRFQETLDKLPLQKKHALEKHFITPHKIDNFFQQVADDRKPPSRRVRVTKECGGRVVSLLDRSSNVEVQPLVPEPPNDPTWSTFCEPTTDLETFAKDLDLRLLWLEGENHLQTAESFLQLKPLTMDDQEFAIWCRKPLWMTASQYVSLIQNKLLLDTPTAHYSPSTTSPLVEDLLLDLERLNDMPNEQLREYQCCQNEAVRLLSKVQLINSTIQDWQYIRSHLAYKLEQLLTSVTDSSTVLRINTELSSLMFGTLRNITSWREGDPAVFEGGLALDALARHEQKLKSKRAEQEIMDNRDGLGYSRIKPGPKQMCYELMADTTKDYQAIERHRRISARLQAVIAFAEHPPTNDELSETTYVLWNCMGISFHSRLWQVFSKRTTEPQVAKIQTIYQRGPVSMRYLKDDLDHALKRTRILDPLPDCSFDLPESKSSCSNLKKHMPYSENMPKISVKQHTNEPETNATEKRRLKQTKLWNYFKPLPSKSKSRAELRTVSGSSSVADKTEMQAEGEENKRNSRQSMDICEATTPNRFGKVVFARDYILRENELIEITPLIHEQDLATYLDEHGPMTSAREETLAKWIILQLAWAIKRLGDMAFILPIKCSRIHFTRDKVAFCAGLPKSCIRKRSWPCLTPIKYIASKVWADTAKDYMPQARSKDAEVQALKHPDDETEETHNSKNKPEAVSKIHTYMIGQVFYRMTVEPLCKQVDLLKAKPEFQGFLSRLLDSNASRRPSLDELAMDPFLQVPQATFLPIRAKSLRSSFTMLKALETFPSLPRVCNDKRPMEYEEPEQRAALQVSLTDSDEEVSNDPKS